MTPREDRESRSRLPHAILDRDSRVWKARKIIALLGQERFRDARRILEIGCGSGVIASTLSAMGSHGLEVHAVDVVDNTIDTTGYIFNLVSGTALPFESGYFDIVISNHVIEHVGGDEDQRRHLQEIQRVLAPAGAVYLAVPNKWRLVEPHYRLPLLSWLPPLLGDRYVRSLGRGTHYDCVPLSLECAMRLFEQSGFVSDDVTLHALRETLAIEHPRSRLAGAFNRYVPDWVPALARRFIPTYVFVLRAVP